MVSHCNLLCVSCSFLCYDYLFYAFIIRFMFVFLFCMFCFLLFVLYFCIVLCIISPLVYSCLSYVCVQFTDHCHRVEPSYSYWISYRIVPIIGHVVVLGVLVHGRVILAVILRKENTRFWTHLGNRATNGRYPKYDDDISGSIRGLKLTDLLSGGSLRKNVLLGLSLRVH
jgi:hypothetical protein